MSIFSRGYKAMKENEEKQKLQSSSNAIWRLFLSGDGDEAPILFLNEEPVNFYEHVVKKKVNGKERYENILCLGSDCELCDDGDKPSPKSAWLVIDQREVTYEDKNGEEQTIENQIRLLVQGTKFASMCDRYSTKYGLTDREWTYVRMGKGKKTNYTLERGDEIELELEDVQELLPEALAEMYDGTEESVQKIIETVLMPNASLDSDEDEDEEDDDNGILSSGDDEDEEDEKPKKKSSLGKKKEKKTIGKKKTESKLKIGKKKNIKPTETKRRSVKEIIKNKK